MGNFKDLTGQRFGHLEVVRVGEPYIEPNGHKVKRWWCLCDCQLSLPENERKLVLVSTGSLRAGHKKTCGCNKFREKSVSMDLTGYKFGCFTVKKRVEKPQNATVSGAYWLCECKCGNTKIYRSADIKRSSPLTCGECSRNTFDISGDYGVGYTTDGKEFYFDLEDYPKIKDYTWCLNAQRYAVAWDGETQKFIYMHRLVVGLTNDDDQYVVDHKKHITYDNRKEEIRVCSRQENMRNSKISKNNISGVTGVGWSPDINKWVARIMLNYKTKHLGNFDNFDDAVKARKEAERIYFKDFSYENSVGG